MSIVVLDTNIVSFIFKGDNKAQPYVARIAGLSQHISFQTLEELWFGAHIRGWGERRRNDLARHLEQYTVIWPSEELVEICAHLRCARQLAGRELANADAWIAVTALMLRCPLVSHDGDFRDIPNLTLMQIR